MTHAHSLFLAAAVVRQARLLSLRWQRRAVFVLGGGVVGVAAVLLALAADWAGAAFEAVAVRMPLAVLALTPLGFAASCWLSRRYFPNSGGSGIPQVIAARQLARPGGAGAPGLVADRRWAR